MTRNTDWTQIERRLIDRITMLKEQLRTSQAANRALRAEIERLKRNQRGDQS